MSAATPAVSQKLVFWIGLGQLIIWGVSFYLIGVFGELIATELGWSRTQVHGGFSVALLVMAAVSPLVGAAIDRLGGKLVMTAGSLLCACGCIALASAHSVEVYYAAWIGLGVAMRCTLYDAAFAALVRVGGKAARPAISQITLLGGLAATCFWPLGHYLAEAFGWRGALLVYAGFALLTVPIHWSIPTVSAARAEAASPKRALKPNAKLLLPAILYALIIALGNGLLAGLSAHLIDILAALGLGVSLAVIAASMRGIGQTLARLAEVYFGGHLRVFDLNLIAATTLLLSFILGLLAGGYIVTAIVFCLAYGGSTGILTITRGALPLALFDPRTYGSMVGKLLVPSYLFAAASPLILAAIMDRWGAYGAMAAAILVATVLVGASLLLRHISQDNAG